MMAFLCDRHRRQVLTETTTAISFWEQWMRQGSELFDQRQWQMAANYLGCSFEVAEWLVNKPRPVAKTDHVTESPANLSPIDRYMLAGHHLSECLGRCGRSDVELHYLLTVHLTLLNIVKARGYQYWLLKQHLEISLAMLRRYCQLYGAFRGYHDCYLETRLCIDQCMH